MSDDKTAQALELVRMALRIAEVDFADLSNLLDGVIDPDEERVTFANFVPTSLGSLHANSIRTYRTHLMRLIEGVPDICECTCSDCCLSVVVAADAWIPDKPNRKRRTAPGHCDSRSCRNRMHLPALGDVVINERTVRKVFTTLEIERWAKAACRIANRRAMLDNTTRTRQGLISARDDGRSAEETCIRAVRRFLAKAHEGNLVTSNPATLVKVPGRQRTRKRALQEEEVPQFIDAVVSGGNDPELDILLVWFHLETGARKEGALNLTLEKVQLENQVVLLNEKFRSERPQPVSTELATALLAHAKERGGAACDPEDVAYEPKSPVFHYRPAKDGRARRLTAKRYETLFGRIQRTVPFANQIHLTAHQLRKTGAVAIERIAGTQVARRWLGHADRSTVDVYASATEGEVRRAHELWTTEE
jgi:integrase